MNNQAKQDIDALRGVISDDPIVEMMRKILINSHERIDAEASKGGGFTPFYDPIRDRKEIRAVSRPTERRSYPPAYEPRPGYPREPEERRSRAGDYRRRESISQSNALTRIEHVRKELMNAVHNFPDRTSNMVLLASSIAKMDFVGLSENTARDVLKSFTKTLKILDPSFAFSVDYEYTQAPDRALECVRCGQEFTDNDDPEEKLCRACLDAD